MWLHCPSTGLLLRKGRVLASGQSECPSCPGSALSSWKALVQPPLYHSEPPLEGMSSRGEDGWGARLGGNYESVSLSWLCYQRHWDEMSRDPRETGCLPTVPSAWSSESHVFEDDLRAERGKKPLS